MKKLTLTSSPLIGVNAPKGATLTATLTSANGTPVEGQVINFSVTLEGATLSGGKSENQLFRSGSSRSDQQ